MWQLTAKMLVIELDNGIRIVGELTGKGPDLLGRRPAELYMAVPKTWPVPPAYQEVLMPDGTLGIADANLIRLRGEYRVRRDDVIRKDWPKVSRRVYWFYHKVQQAFWTDLFSQGIILAIEDYDLDYEHIRSNPLDTPKRLIRFLIPKSLPHKLPDDVPEDLKFKHLWEHHDQYLPQEPESRDNYDEYIYGELDADEVSGGNPCFGNTPGFRDFEPVRHAIQMVLDVQ
jgi:hypothetical protein